ncbi:malonyl-CoA decarboxylase, mitochondrial isoform X2 [Macadamia integrifolia]|uniref:malonyl-CoA decarboxylase, mitochondrial isoform X2 n=1 Tax=Macadamia integrifolia TaxID=60698 RepID=UPI001C52C646|nr:malonyl-CoA decarboxylase, mitochondrial isoform X2 [Macadamia integrifolia]
MNRKGLAILMRAKMKPADPSKFSIPANEAGRILAESRIENDQSDEHQTRGAREELERTSIQTERELKLVQESMHSAISMNKTEVLDGIMSDFSEGYFSLSHDNRRKLLLVLARDYDVSRTQVRELIRKYVGLELPDGDFRSDNSLSSSSVKVGCNGNCMVSGDKAKSSDIDEEGLLCALYRTERNLRHALQPMYEVLFERLNTHPGGLKFLTILRADLLAMLAKENNASLRALDSYLKEKLVTWLSPAALELHRITWDDPASLLEKIVAYEAVHPISNLIDLKRRLGVGRRCFGYLHPAIPGEPLVFIEVALLKDVAQKVQDVLHNDPSTPEFEAKCALFYSISSTQPGLSGINLGKFLIKRVVELLKRDMPYISTFATLSPVPGFLPWLLSKLAYQSKLTEAGTEDAAHSSAGGLVSTFRENILKPDEERVLLELGGFGAGKYGMEVMLNLLTSTKHEWVSSDTLSSVLQAPLMRLCARYLFQEKKRGKALDAVANFHLQNGAMVERLNWMADLSEKGLHQSGGIMVNYVYRLDKIEENAQSYFSTGHIEASSKFRCLLEEPSLSSL